jgi:anti-sigma B factor antagonist
LRRSRTACFEQAQRGRTDEGRNDTAGKAEREDHMFTISKKKEGTNLRVTVAGRLDSTTAPDLEKAIKDDIAGITDLTIDIDQLEYISSAGLRVLLASQKIMNAQGKMTVTHPNEVIAEIFEVTGFSDILTIE